MYKMHRYCIGIAFMMSQAWPADFKGAICDREACKHILRDTLNDSYIYLHVNHEDIP